MVVTNELKEAISVINTIKKIITPDENDPILHLMSNPHMGEAGKIYLELKKEFELKLYDEIDKKSCIEREILAVQMIFYAGLIRYEGEIHLLKNSVEYSSSSEGFAMMKKLAPEYLCTFSHSTFILRWAIRGKKQVKYYEKEHFLQYFEQDNISDYEYASYERQFCDNFLYNPTVTHYIFSRVEYVCWLIDLLNKYDVEHVLNSVQQPKTQKTPKKTPNFDSLFYDLKDLQLTINSLKTMGKIDKVNEIFINERGNKGVFLPLYAFLIDKKKIIEISQNKFRQAVQKRFKIEKFKGGNFYPQTSDYQNNYDEFCELIC